MEQSGGLPKFVVREFEEFLECGIPEEGCLHLVCRSFGYWKDGTRAIVLEPDDLLVRLVAAVTAVPSHATVFGHPLESFVAALRDCAQAPNRSERRGTAASARRSARARARTERR